MKLIGALVNNLYLMNTRLTRIYTLVPLALLAAYFATGNTMFAGFFMLMAILVVPTTSLENAGVPFATRWSSFENTWALSPHLMVVSRYILYIILSAIGVGIWLAVPISYYDESGFFTLANLIFMAQIMCIAYYPVMYFFNPRKESFSIAMVFASMGIAVGLTAFMNYLAAGNYTLMALIVACMYVVSIALSVAFNKVHLGRVA